VTDRSDSVGPSESSAQPLARVASPLLPHPLVEFTCRSESYMSAAYRGYCFAKPLRRWPFPRPCGFLPADTGGTRLLNSCRILSSASAFLQSLRRSNLAEHRRLRDAPDPSHGLSFPSAHTSREDPLNAGLALPASFRLQGLVTLLTVYSPHGLAGLVSSRQRSWDSSLRSVLLSQGSRRVSATAEPACRQPRAISHR